MSQIQRMYVYVLVVCPAKETSWNSFTKKRERITENVIQD